MLDADGATSSRALRGGLAAGGLAFVLAGCVGPMPTPLAPAVRGSVGVPHHGVVTDAVELPKQGEGYRLLRSKGNRWGTPRLVALIEDAAREVARARPLGEPLVVGDLSARYGGETKGHRSHRTGRDADLLLFALTPDGRPVRAPGFVAYGPDGLAKVEPGVGAEGAERRLGALTAELRDGAAMAPRSAVPEYVRLDVERQWLLVKALIRSPAAHVQWLFVASWLEALLIEYARARGEEPELVWYAESVLLQPGDSSAHADHIHLRIACAPEEQLAGCAGGGPQWPWLPAAPELASPSDAELAAALLDEFVPGAGRASSHAEAASGAP